MQLQDYWASVYYVMKTESRAVIFFERPVKERNMLSFL